MPMSWGKVTALTSDLAYPAILFPKLGEVVSYGCVWGKVTALTSGLAYPAILFPEPFYPGRGLGEVLKNSKCLDWWATQGPRRALLYLSVV